MVVVGGLGRYPVAGILLTNSPMHKLSRGSFHVNPTSEVQLGQPNTHYLELSPSRCDKPRPKRCLAHRVITVYKPTLDTWWFQPRGSPRAARARWGSCYVAGSSLTIIWGRFEGPGSIGVRFGDFHEPIVNTIWSKFDVPGRPTQ